MGTFVSLRHPTHRPFSSSRKRTASYDQYKIIEKSMPLQFEISTPSLSSQILFATSATHTSIRSSMSAGGITMYASAKATNPRQRLKPDMAFLNPRSCTSDLPIHQRHSRL